MQRLNNSSCYFLLFSYCPGSHSVTRVLWYFCTLDSLWFPFLVPRLPRNKPELLTNTLPLENYREKLAAQTVKRQFQRRRISVTAWRNHGRSRRRSKLMSFNHSYRKGINEASSVVFWEKFADRDECRRTSRSSFAPALAAVSGFLKTPLSETSAEERENVSFIRMASVYGWITLVADCKSYFSRCSGSI